MGIYPRGDATVMPDRLLEALAVDPLYQGLRRAIAARREQIGAELDATRLPAGGAGELRREMRAGLSAVIDAMPADLAEEVIPTGADWSPDDAAGVRLVAEAVTVTEDDGSCD
jgi:hypothetical protein